MSAYSKKVPGPVDVPELAIGKLFGNRFRVNRVVGKGAIGTVYEGTDDEDGTRVAIKRLHRAMLDSPEMVARFEREIRTTADLTHENVVRMIAGGETQDGSYFMAMEYLDGTTLKNVLAEEGSLPLRRSLDIGRQVLSGLQAAHDAGIVHRDLKPDNIMLCPDPEQPDRKVAKILDFGIARRLAGPETTSLTRAGAVFGTPAYMSPEQAAGTEIGTRSDLYTFAVTLYEMVSDERPFEADDPLKLIAMQISEPPPPLSSRFEDLEIPATLEGAIMMGLRKSPDDRFQTADDFRQALDLAERALDAPPAEGVTAELVFGPALRQARRRIDAAGERTRGWMQDRLPLLQRGVDWLRANVAEPVKRVAEPVKKAAAPVLKAMDPVWKAAKPVVDRVPEQYRRWIGVGLAGLLVLLLIIWVAVPDDPAPSPVGDVTPSALAEADVGETLFGRPDGIETSTGDVTADSEVDPETVAARTAVARTAVPATSAPTAAPKPPKRRELPRVPDRSDEEVLDGVLEVLALDSEAEGRAAEAMRRGDTLDVIRNLKGAPDTLAVRLLRGRALALQDRWKEAQKDLLMAYEALPSLRRDDVVRDRALAAIATRPKATAPARAVLEAMGMEATPAVVFWMYKAHDDAVVMEERLAALREAKEKIPPDDRKRLQNARRIRNVLLRIADKAGSESFDFSEVWVGELGATHKCETRKALIRRIKKHEIVDALPELERIRREGKKSTRCLETVLPATIKALEKKRDGT